MDEPEEGDTAPGPTITVRGLGFAPARPDGVRLVLTVRHRADSAEEALGRTADKAHMLESLLLEHGIEQDRWVTAGIGLDELNQWDDSSRQEISRGYMASSRTVVTLPDTGSLGRLLAEAASRVDATAIGPEWEVSPQNPANDESRRRAVTDARRRAETYAEAAGHVVAELIQVVEVGAHGPGRTMRLPSHLAGVAMSGGADMPAHAEGLQVVAAIDVTYSLKKT
jgi:uncharacterized protein YggE